MNIVLNGVNIHYERKGKGYPLVMLHGNGEDSGIFCESAALLARDYEVILMDSRCHGKSGGGALGYRYLAADTAALIKALGLDKPVIVGFSDGGIIGIMLASEYRGLIGGLIACGANLTPDGIKKQYIKMYMADSTDPFVKMMLNEPDIKFSALKDISVPAAVFAGEYDVIKRAHTRRIAASIRCAELHILEGETHSSYVTDGKNFYAAILPALKRMTEKG